jgi:hypothetical protein
LAEVIEPVQCGNPDCKVAIDGKCVEGQTFDKCPYYGKLLQPRSDATTGVMPAPGTKLPTGELLTVAEANAVLRRAVSRVIAIVGPKEAGKTTLIASLFELFLRGSIGPFRFCSSKTLFAFERACHPSRAISQNVVPTMERTLLTDVRFYHLATRKEGESVVDLLLADRNGEDYGDSPDEPSTTSGFAEIARADIITFLVDGAQLADLATRVSIAAQIVAIAQALIDGGAIERPPRVAIVLTKVDRIRKSQDPDRTMRDFEKLVTRFRDRFRTNFIEVKEFAVAACPSDTSLQLGYGVSALLDYWEHKILRRTEPAPAYVPRKTRFMDRLQGSPE